jgi:hypothetical protein
MKGVFFSILKLGLAGLVLISLAVCIWGLLGISAVTHAECFSCQCVTRDDQSMPTGISKPVYVPSKADCVSGCQQAGISCQIGIPTTCIPTYKPGDARIQQVDQKLCVPVSMPQRLPRCCLGAHISPGACIVCESIRKED